MHFLPFFGAGDLQFCEARRLGLVRPWDPLLGVPSLPLVGGPPAAGRQRVFSWVASLLSSSHTWEARMWSATAGAQGTGAVCSRLSPPVLGPHGGRGHTCRTPPWACSVSRKSDATSRRSLVRYLQNSLCPGDVGSRHPCPQGNDALMDTVGHADAPAACIVMESSGRAGPSVTGNDSRREGHAEKERYPWSG